MQNTLKCVQDEDHKALIFFFLDFFQLTVYLQVLLYSLDTYLTTLTL